MTFGSVCSGIEAASCAWGPLGFRATFVSEVEPFCRALLKHHYPEVPNHGDFTTIRESEPVDILVGGTPCQSFSVAGKRAGLDDPRGNLTLEFLALAGRLRPRWVVWENVPGVLSDDGGRTFGTILGLLGQLGYGFAYRILDAQYFGVPQRRRRIFVIGCLGDWRPAAAVLFERHCLQGNSTPRRQKREEIAGTLGGGSSKRGWCDDTDRTTFVAPTLNAGSNSTGGHRSPGMSIDTVDSLITDTVRSHPRPGSNSVGLLAFNSREDCVSGEIAGSLGSSSPQAQAVAFDTTQITSKANVSNPKPGDPCHPLASGAHPPALAINFRGREGGTQAELGDDVATALRCAGGTSSKSHTLTQMAVRRLTPRECERLQGFADDYTLIPYRNKPAADGPRYRALGNSMAVPVMRFLGERILMAEGLMT